MIVNFFSDIHDEHTVFIPPPVRADLRVVAGDIDAFRRPDAVAELLHLDTLCILGNHDFDGMTIEDGKEAWKEVEEKANGIAERRGLPGRLDVVEDCGMRVYGKVRFVCATLWTDMDRRNPSVMQRVTCPVTFMDSDGNPVTAPLISDFENIKDFTLETWLRENERHAAFIEEELSKAWDGHTVLMTHHLPSWSLISEGYVGDGKNGAYVSNYDRWIGDPTLTVLHGHVHDSHNKVLGETKCHCNPRGYDNPLKKRRPNAEFDSTMTIDL